MTCLEMAAGRTAASSLQRARSVGVASGIAVRIEPRPDPRQAAQVVLVQPVVEKGSAGRRTAAVRVTTVFREGFAAGVRGLVEGGSPVGTDPALKGAHLEKVAAVRQPAGLRSIEGLVRWDMDAALRETKQPITVFAIRTSSPRKPSTATVTGSTSCSSIWAATTSRWSRQRTRRSSWPA
ncbi:hypothetical protein GCM10020001_039120 [Nonomuraea salmonea]